MSTKSVESVRRPVGRPADWKLRERVFRAVCRAGAVSFNTAPRIAKLVKTDLVTVNNHLRVLASFGLVEVVGAENRPGRGRPSKVYALTEFGEAVSTFR